MMSSHVDLDRFNLTPLSLATPCACQCRPSSETLVFARRSAKLRLSLSFDKLRGFIRVRQDRRAEVFAAIARAQPDPLDEEKPKEEVEKGDQLGMAEKSVSDRQHQTSQLKKRVIFGLGIGLSVGGVVLAGGLVFTATMAAAVFVGSREFFELVRSRGITLQG